MKFKIEKKRKYKDGKNSVTFLTSTYGGEFFNIPKSQIISEEEVNEELIIIVTNWIWNKKNLEYYINKISGSKIWKQT